MRTRGWLFRRWQRADNPGLGLFSRNFRCGPQVLSARKIRAGALESGSYYSVLSPNGPDPCSRLNRWDADFVDATDWAGQGRRSATILRNH